MHRPSLGRTNSAEQNAVARQGKTRAEAGAGAGTGAGQHSGVGTWAGGREQGGTRDPPLHCLQWTGRYGSGTPQRRRSQYALHYHFTLHPRLLGTRGVDKQRGTRVRTLLDGLLDLCSSFLCTYTYIDIDKHTKNSRTQAYLHPPYAYIKKHFF